MLNDYIQGYSLGQVWEISIAPVKYVLFLATWYYLPRVLAIAQLSAQGINNISIFDEVYIV